MSEVEKSDVVVVGARLAGCALAAPLARAGRKVVVLDRMSFPSDQLSTHVLFSNGVAELASLGALPRILALDPTKVHRVALHAGDVCMVEPMRPFDGIDYGVCVPRDMQDVCLVEAAREQGAEIRERSTFESPLWRNGRVSGVRYRDGDGEEHEIEASLVVGADGRRSSVAAAVGAFAPYRRSRNGRGLVFRYMDDPSADPADRDTYIQWRDGTSFAYAFPCTPAGRLLVLFMGHRDEVSDARRDPEGHWRRKVAEHPALARRLAGVDESSYSKVRSTASTPAFFRASSGPGWALAGDAGHFKDPVTGQGMRDSLWMGRTLAERVMPALDDPAAVDRVTREWEAARDRHCLPAYHLANIDTRVETSSPVLREVLRHGGVRSEPDLADLFCRGREPSEVLTLPRVLRALGSAFARADVPRREVAARSIAEAKRDILIRREARRDEFRPARPIPGSDHPGAEFPDPPAPAPRAAEAPAPEPEAVRA
ncbi:MAG: NAD(P)/FAD-dependent oxidoreductase [Thermoleophilales bacterium]|nr:NAD(P)/FAD-dependent oxidoreductase [Thermoleophilales bacterium]